MHWLTWNLPDGWNSSPYPSEEEVRRIQKQVRQGITARRDYDEYWAPINVTARWDWAMRERAYLGRKGMWPPPWDYYGYDPRTPEEISEWGESGPHHLPLTPDQKPRPGSHDGEPMSDNPYEDEQYRPPPPERVQDLAREKAIDFFEEAKAAYERGVWQTHASHHARSRVVNPELLKGGTTVVQPKEGKRTLRLAYFFAGVKRKASVAEELKKLCTEGGFGLQVFEVGVLIGGSEHDLLDKAIQDEWIGRLEDGEFDCVLLSPPCGTWSRANWANKLGPKPCRNRRWPWGIPHQKRSQQARAENGNEFINFPFGPSRRPRSAAVKVTWSGAFLNIPKTWARRTMGSRRVYGSWASSVRLSGIPHVYPWQDTNANFQAWTERSPRGSTRTSSPWRILVTFLLIINRLGTFAHRR